MRPEPPAVTEPGDRDSGSAARRPRRPGRGPSAGCAAGDHVIMMPVIRVRRDSESLAESRSAMALRLRLAGPPGPRAGGCALWPDWLRGPVPDAGLKKTRIGSRGLIAGCQARRRPGNRATAAAGRATGGRARAQ